MPESPLRVAVVGAGVVGTMRARTILAQPRTQLWGIVDVDLARAERLAAGRAKVLADWRGAVEAPEVDAVIVSTPAHMHEDVVLAALAAGKHVLCEKPLAPGVPACERMLACAARYGVRLAVGFNHRYYPCFRYLREVIAGGWLGPIDYVRVSAGHLGLGEFRAPWMYQSERSGGGAMMDIGIHLTDLARSLAGEIRYVWGRTSNRVWNVPGSEDNAMALFETAGGVPIAYHASWSEWKGYRMCIDVYGRDGTVRGYYAPMFNLLARRTPGGGRRRSLKLYPLLNLRERLYGWERTAGDAFAAELADFVALVERGPEAAGLLADGVAGERAVAIAHAVYASQRSGERVTLA